MSTTPQHDQGSHLHRDGSRGELRSTSPAILAPSSQMFYQIVIDHQASNPRVRLKVTSPKWFTQQEDEWRDEQELPKP